MYKKMGTVIQELFIKEFGFKKGASEYLELKLGDDLLELRVYALLDEVLMSVHFYKDDDIESYLSMTSIEETFLLIKNIVKKNKGNK